MAFADDLRNFLEQRLLSYDPSIDLSDNSPAQLQIISPTIERFGEDPFSTDIPTFIHDRLVQEFPDMAADGGGLLEEMLSQPLQLLLEPFKREIELVKLGESITNSSIMSEDEVDALGANWFIDRNQGDYSSGTVRIFFAQPTSTRVTTDKRFSTSGGLSFFPIQNYIISSQQMLFNKQGSFFFLDVQVRAENPGSDYNVSKGAINSVEAVAGIVKVANLTDFTTGDPREANDQYVGRIETALTDRSLVTKRGILSRTTSLFDGVRALQVVGAGDDGMNRDILTGTGQGFLHLAGKATIYGNWLWSSEITYRDDGPSNLITPQPGDTIRFHPVSPAPSVTDVVTVTVTSILSASSGLYLFLLDSSPYGTTVVQNGAFALLKPGNITITNVPGGISADITVADGEVHLGGHTDIFVRPTQDADVIATLSNVSDDEPIVAVIDLSVVNANDNLVQSSTDFVAVGTSVGDLLVIDTGPGFAGTYRILEIPSNNTLRLDSIFSTTSTDLRARVIHDIRLNLVEPRIPKLPYTNSPVSDLQTNVGSNDFRFATISIQSFGAVVGDTINILEGPDAGEFTIIGFGVSNNVFVDRLASATGANLSYQVYTKQAGLVRPLVRLKSIEVLDSTGQTTGITVPYGDAVDIRPTEKFEGAGSENITYEKTLVIFPDISEWSGLAQDPISLGAIDDTTDARYTLGLAVADGVVRQVTHDASNQVQTTEINVPPFAYDGKRNKLLALIDHVDPNYPLSIPGVHKTSDIAEAKIGDSITINDGPNQGKYIITDIRVLDLWGKTDQGHRKVAMVQVDPPFRVDPIRTAINFINQLNGSAFWTTDQLFGFIQYAADWDNASGFYTTFLTQLHTSLTSIGISYSDVAALKTFFDTLIKTSYTVGPSAKGTFRNYFLEPVSCDFFSGTNPTTFSLASDGSKLFRVDPAIPPAQILPESVTPTAPALWNRNLGVRDPQDTYAYLTSGSSFVSRGIQVGDEVEWHPAINDLPARGAMTSSWMCTTQGGSNVVQLILPQSDATSEAGYGGVDNYETITAGQLLFIDSGPDIGAYTVTKVLTQDWASNPPVIQLQLDKTMTHTTELFPVLSTGTVPPPQADFSSALPAYVQGTAITFPISLNGTNLKIDVSTDGGANWTSVEHTFTTADPYANIAAVVSDITADDTFSTSVKAVANGNSLALVHPTAGPRTRVRINTSPTAPSAHATLNLTNGAVGAGVRGAATVPGTKRLYGTGLNQCLINDWITLYAAKNDAVLLAGDDVAIIGTFKITAVGSDATSAPYWSPYGTYVELDRSDNFPAGSYAEVRWLRHDAPEVTPTDTSGGGKEISDQFVRFRLYDAVAERRTITAIPWASSPHPLLTTSTQQITLSSPGIINTGGGQRNFSHKSPFRVVRPDLFRIASTEMSTNREGALYYVDIPVVSYGADINMNVSTEEGFVLAGNRAINGYTLEVADENFVFSTKEEVHLILPNSVLPVGATAELTSQFNLAGQNLQVTYNNAPLVEDLQSFFDSPLDRVTSASMLARHFLPGYVFLDLAYSGGSTEADVAAEIINYVNNIDPDTAEIRTDLIQDIVKRKGASTVTLPLTIITLFHGIDRRIRGMRSQTSIGIGNTPFFKGNFRQTYFIPGPNTSSTATRPSGEQIFLVRV